MRRLAPGDHQDFAQSVHLKLVQGNYGVFAKFRGDSSLRTYLSVVVSRALLDWRNARYGKWRPSAAAARLGPEAVALERSMSRDGRTLDEAIEIVHQSSGQECERLRALIEQLPNRITRRTVDPGEVRFV